MRLILLLLLGMSLGLAAQDDKLFSIGFDSYAVNADEAKGDPKGYDFGEDDLQLRMFPGVNGKGNSLNLANSEGVNYKMAGNFLPKQGTVSLWVCPQNWQINEDGWQLFFSANQKNFYLRIMKVNNYYISASINYNYSPGKEKAFSIGVAARVNPEDWAPGKWHKLDLTWDDKNIALYIDGRIPQKTPIKIGKQNVPPTAPVKEFPHRMDFPEPAGTFTIGNTKAWQQRKEINREHKTAFDMVSIYGRPLSSVEIIEEYEKIIPPAKNTETALNFTVIPKIETPVNVDGKLDDPVWRQATKVRMKKVSEDGTDNHNWAMAAHDGQKLYIAFSTDAPCRKKVATERDGRLWEDDSFEFHLMTADKQHYQFIINGNGAIFDQLNGRASWNSGAVGAAHLSGQGWSVEMAIPLAELGGLEKLQSGVSQADFCGAWHDGLSTVYSRWGSYRSGKFKPHDEVIFGKTGEFFRLNSVGSPENGMLELSAEGSKGVTGEASLAPYGYPAVKYPGNLTGKTWSRKLAVGKQTLEVSAEKIYYYREELQVSFPLELTHNNRPADKLIEVEINMTNIGVKGLEKLGKDGVNGTLWLVSPSGEKSSEVKFTQKKNIDKVVLPFPENPQPGTWTIRAETLGDESSFSREIPFRIPDLTPYRQRVGGDNSVPAPWTPVKNLGDGRYEVWGRCYEFGNAPFPKQIRAGKDELLKQGPEWKINGGAVQWGEPRITGSGPDCIKFAGSGKIEKLVIEWTGELWFDGAYILNFKLIPDKTQKIDRFTIDYKVAAEFGKYAMDPIYVPWQDNRVEVSLEYDARRKDNVIWVSGFEKGVFMWIKSNANWVNRKDEKPLVAVKGKDDTAVTLNIISQSAELKKTAEYTMAFMGTPSRSMGDDFRQDNSFGYGRGPTTLQSVGWGQHTDKASPSDMTSWNSATPAYPDEFREKVLKPFQAKGVKVQIYSMPSQLSNVEPDYDYFGLDNMSTPRRVHSGSKLGVPFSIDLFCPNATGLTGDLWSYRMAETMDKYPGVVGYYFDVASTKYCESTVHGCGGIDAFGQRYSSSDALGLRAFLMQVYKAVKSRNGQTMLHSHVQFVPLSHGFIDFFLPGENTFKMLVNNIEYGYCDNYSLGLYLTDMNQRKAGIPYHVLFQTGRVCRLMPAFRNERKRIENDPEYAIRAMTPMLLHDLNVCPSYVDGKTVYKYWDIRKAVNLSEARFHGYWESDAVKSGSPKIHASWYEWDKPSPYAKMLVVANLSREAAPIKLALDKKALKIGPDTRLHDIWNDRPITEAELSSAPLPGNHFMLIGINSP